MFTGPETNFPVNAVADIPFSQIQTALNAKTAWVSGEHLFEYGVSGNGTPQQITLTANAANVSIAKWQYGNSSSA